MKAVILAGGEGLRMRPYTRILPKPLLPVDDVPILEILLRQLHFYGISDIIITVGHLAELIELYFGDGSRLGMTIRYFKEEKPLGTLGSLPMIEDPGKDFVVLNGDILTDLDIRKLISYHKRKKSIATIATFRRDQHIDFGVMEFGRDRRVTNFHEKPLFNYDVSMGIYVFNKVVLGYIPRGKAFGFDDLMYRLVAKSDRVFSYGYNGYWRDLGRSDDYKEAVKDFAKDRQRFFREVSDKAEKPVGASAKG